MPTTTTPSLRILRDAESALALLDPDRRRLAEALAEAPDSAAGLARRLGEKRQRLNYHLRVLEDAGLVELAEERRRGNRTERVMQLVATRFVVDPGAVGAVAIRDPDEVGDRFSATYLVALAARAIRELAALMDRAKEKRSRLASASVNASVRIASPGQLDAFVGDLTRAVADVVARYHEEDGDGRWFRVIAGAYPGPSPQGEENRS
ncbi:MAG TPA: helix-turn-helix domain-containing protein [Longimicrobiales bacterium]